MGGLVAVVSAVAVVLAVVLARAASLDELTRTGAVAAVLVGLLGRLEALTMIVHGGHTVGAADSRDRHLMWVTGWSLDHGDLRVGHFVGLHGLQAILVSGWWLRHHRGDDECAARALAIISIGYAGLVVLLTWQAELGRPQQRPGPILGVAGLVVVLITGIAAAHTWRPATTPVRVVDRRVDHPRPSAPQTPEPTPCQ